VGTPKKVVISERWSVTAEEFLDIRLKLRLSQTKIAKLMGIHVNTVRRLEKGLMLPRWAALAVGYLEDHYSPQQTTVKTPTNLKEAYDENQLVDRPVAVPFRKKSSEGVDDTGTPESA